MPTSAPSLADAACSQPPPIGSSPQIPPALQPCASILRRAYDYPYKIEECVRPAATSGFVDLLLSGENGKRSPKARLPYIPYDSSTANECEIAIVDPSWNDAANPTNWSVHKLDALCWPNDAARSAHLIKTTIPMLLPRIPYVWYGDSKCKAPDAPYGWLKRLLVPHPETRANGDSSLLRPAADLLAVHNFKDLSIQDEFDQTRQHMRHRGMHGGINGQKPPYSVRAALREAMRDVELQRQWYAAQQYDFGVKNALPDAMCLVWHNTTLAWRFACQWSHEVLTLSMREQLSFHHAQPPGLQIQWVTFPKRLLFGFGDVALTSW